MRKELGKGTADDDVVRVVFLDELGEAEGDAEGDVRIGGGAADRGGAATVGEAEGGARGDVLPFVAAVVVYIYGVAGFNGAGIFGERAVSGEATADAGGEGEVKAKTAAAGGFVNGGEVGIVF